LNAPLVTFGVPVYGGKDSVPTTLECLRTQTYANIEVLISVNAADQASAEACKPFLQRDSRFRMYVQSSHLGWAGSVDWTMRERKGDFYIYLHCDDQVSPTYVADLVEAATRWPDSAICFSEMAISGERRVLVRDRPVLGDPISRALTHIERLDASVFRGLIRGSMLDTTRGMRISELDSYGSEHPLMTELALAGEFRFVRGPTYFKRIDQQHMGLKSYMWPEHRKRDNWACLAAWLVGVIVPVGSSLEQRRMLFEHVAQRFFAKPTGFLNWLRLRSAWVHTLHNETLARAFRTLMDMGRQSGYLDSWIKGGTRAMFYVPDPSDSAAMTALVRAFVDHLRREAIFDPNSSLGWSWETLEGELAGRFPRLHQHAEA